MEYSEVAGEMRHTKVHVPQPTVCQWVARHKQLMNNSTASFVALPMLKYRRVQTMLIHMLHT